MSGIAIYMEGGGDRKNGKAALRQGMDEFLAPLKDAAREKSLRWRLVCCGGRDEAFRGFKNAVNNREEPIIALLVDAEAPLTDQPIAHLRKRDGWVINFAADEAVHLMVQTMEAWIVADPDALASYYGQEFCGNCLPKAPNIENTEKTDIEAALVQATRRTQKGAYHKIHHASDLLKRIDREKVKRRSPNCARMFMSLGNAIQNA